MLWNNNATLKLINLMKHNFSPEAAVKLVAQGGNPNIKITRGLTLLHILIIENNDKGSNDKYIEYLVETYRTIVNLYDDLGLTPLAYMISRNSFILETAMKLVECGANPNTLAKDGNSLLHLIIRNKTTNVIKQSIRDLICIYKADIEIRDNCGNTPVEYLLKKQNYKMAMYLISLGAKITNNQLKPSLIEIFVKSENEKTCQDLQRCLINYGFFNQEKINQHRTNFLNFLLVLAQSLETKSNGLFSKLPIEMIFTIINHFNFDQIKITQRAGLELSYQVLNDYQNIKLMLKTYGGVNVIQSSNNEFKFFKSVNTLREDYNKYKKKQPIACLFAKITGNNKVLKKFIADNTFGTWFEYAPIFNTTQQYKLRPVDQSELYNELQSNEISIHSKLHF